ncbi:MAG: hypothetical protein ABH832_03125 [bacterium]
MKLVKKDNRIIVEAYDSKSKKRIEIIEINQNSGKMKLLIKFSE